MDMLNSFRAAMLLSNDGNLTIKQFFGDNPLFTFIQLGLEGTKCPLDVLLMLLDHGADVNYTDVLGNSPLKIAIENSQDEEIIRALLERGATVDTLDVITRRSPLCNAFRYCSNDVIKMMLDAGYSPNTCEYHMNALFCATDRSKSGLREDILDRLLEEEVDLNGLLDSGHSLFCFALCYGNNKSEEYPLNLYVKIQNLELLLNKGASITACRHHDSPLLCATSVFPVLQGLQLEFQKNVLQESVIKLFLDRGASVGDYGLDILEFALGERDYEVGAIRLLLDAPGMADCIKENNALVLEFAFRNKALQEEVVEMLLSRMSARAIKGCKNLLHFAVSNCLCTANIVRLLMKYDLPVNKQNGQGETPLYIAVHNVFRWDEFDCKVILELLIAGARIGVKKCCFEHDSSLLGCVFKQYNILRTGSYFKVKRIECFKILVGFFFIENPKFGFEDFKRILDEDTWSKTFCSNEGFKQFLNECMDEIRGMESCKIGDELTLCDYIRGYCLPDIDVQSKIKYKKDLSLKLLLQKTLQSCLPNELASHRRASVRILNLDNFFKSIADNKFKVFFKVLLARLDVSVIKQALPNVEIYALRKVANAEKVYLNEHVLDKISTYLSKKDLLSFILAFYNHNKCTINNQLGSKRRSESTTKQHKFPKIC